MGLSSLFLLPLRTAEVFLMKQWWEGMGEGGVAVDTLLRRDRYTLMRDLLAARDGNGQAKIEIQVIDRFTAPLIHGKAGIITLADQRGVSQVD